MARSLTPRTLAGRGFVVAAMITPGGPATFVTGSATALTVRVIPLADAVDVNQEELVSDNGAAPGEAATVARRAAAWWRRWPGSPRSLGPSADPAHRPLDPRSASAPWSGCSCPRLGVPDRAAPPLSPAGGGRDGPRGRPRELG